MPDLPHIFISAATREFQKERQQVMELVTQHGFHPVVQEAFDGRPHSVMVQEALETKLQPCLGVIHLCGFFYGARPADYQPGEARRSCAQMEFYLAQEKQKHIFVALADEATYKPLCRAQTKQKAAVQLAHYESLRATGRPHYAFKTISDIQTAISSFLWRFVAGDASQAV